ncbi:hypothetical protein E3N88_00190 [Mikania micrantha]|uniref:Protein kinase domain-containing protein n=1 Tax=Mikania micrantha TaxID=192012 RepID=A0A5N6PXC6_9ASTR|nr:hypothetical protein E3N88_00190 [Mikania micrantha]
MHHNPKYENTREIIRESDVYSFGVVLLEILCGRPVDDPIYVKGSNDNLPTIATLSFRVGTLEDMMDPILKKQTNTQDDHSLSEVIKNNYKEGKLDALVLEQIREQIVPKSLTTFQEIAYQCLHIEREKRPTTKELLTQLKKALAFQEMATRMTKFAHLQIPLDDVVKATDNLHQDNIVTCDGFGTTYKGQILHTGRVTKIAAKRFDCKNGEGDLEFLAEFSALSDLNHTNLVSFIGYCDEKDEKIIITTFEDNGNLAQYLNTVNLTWTQRLRISLGVARALSYLHYDEGRDYAIIHCNINSNTILLDEKLEAKLSCFETSIKQLIRYKDHVCCHCYHVTTRKFCSHTLHQQPNFGTKFPSTRGWCDTRQFQVPQRCITGDCDPDSLCATYHTNSYYAIENTVTHKSDIHSLGVVLFEMLCGRNSFVQSDTKRLLDPHKLHDIILPNMWNQIFPRSLIGYSMAAYTCLEDNHIIKYSTACSGIEEKQVRTQNAHNIVEILEKALESQLQHEYNARVF